MSLLRFVEWLAETPVSVAIRESIYAFPIIESSHVLAICLFVGMTAMLDLRLLDLTMRTVSVAEVTRRLLPWMIAGFVLMVLTGALTFLNDPVRYFNNVFFRAKAVMLVLAGLNVWVFYARVHRDVDSWDPRSRTPAGAKAAGLVSLVLWAGVIVAGRMMAYNWFD